MMLNFDHTTNIDNIINDNFAKISKISGVAYPIINYNINENNEYFKVKFDQKTSNEIVDEATKKINKVFETNEKRLKEIDDTKIDDILKKLKI